MNWSPDWGLRARMLLTVGLLAGLYAVFIGVLLTVNAGLLTIIVVMGLFMLGQLFFSDRLALYSMGASAVSEEEYPELHAAVSRLSQQADLPVPTVAVSDTRVPNAFATGRSQATATICVTTGLLETLDADELEGVLAHELAHIKNRDVMVMTLASFFSTLALLVVRWGWLFGGGGDEESPPVFLAIIASFVVWILSFVLIRTLSRYREFAADRGGAVITGRPSALASALAKISGEMDRVPDRDLRENAEMNAFFIHPLRSGVIGRLFSTHPSTDDRIARLRALENELETV
ncbi:zinc metalloprotease HtpX [Halorubrum sp. Atlit-26R]|uniref:zinc metalloprotease HtpX n=1 Tax=Halorubrum sp. Atlit-26R TaxID=2282128 RepID=UPI000EF22F97|nr:zinc metalloprotease HtpX [Halorubrum sp. Atlit-26R]RLM62626.1 zinc metalloprotease HtpX [Halorubrum sp. Atlit-26R]